MARYSFVTLWRFEAPIERVYEAIREWEKWPSWWKGVVSVEKLKEGNDDGVGSVSRYVWKSALPYKLKFDMTTTVVERPHRIEGEAEGELAGFGRWRLAQRGNVTTVRYDWQIETTRWWMNLLAPLARPAFVWNHDYIMRAGGEGLARLLGVRLLESKNIALPASRSLRASS